MFKHLPVFIAALFSVAAAASDSTTKAAVESANPATKTSNATTFDSLDKNGDERISRTEAGMDKNLSNTFGIADTDGDGYVSKAEFVARPQG